MADTFLYHMVHQTHQDIGNLVSLDLLLSCVSHPDYEVRTNTSLESHSDYEAGSIKFKPIKKFNQSSSNYVFRK